MYDGMPIPDTPRQSHMYLQLDLLPPNKIGDCIYPVIAAFVLSSSDLFSTNDRCKELEKEKEDPNTLLKEYKVRLQNAEQDILKKYNCWGH